jgi:hypothetical protein
VRASPINQLTGPAAIAWASPINQLTGLAAAP